MTRDNRRTLLGLLGLAALVGGVVAGRLLTSKQSVSTRAPQEKHSASVEPPEAPPQPVRLEPGTLDRHAGRSEFVLDLHAQRVEDTGTGEKFFARLRAGSLFETPVTVAYRVRITTMAGELAVPDSTVDMGTLKPRELKDSDFEVGPLPDGFFRVRVTATATVHLEQRSNATDKSLFFAVDDGRIVGFNGATEWHRAASGGSLPATRTGGGSR